MSVRSDMHDETLTEATAQISTWTRLVPAELGQEAQVIRTEASRAVEAVRGAVSKIERLRNPAPDDPAVSDPDGAILELRTSAEATVTEALGKVDAAMTAVSRKLERQALPPAPSGAAALAAREAIREVVGEAKGAAALQGLEALVRDADDVTLAELASPWGQAFARRAEVDPGALVALVLKASAAGRFGPGRARAAEALGQWGRLTRGRKGLGALASILADEERR